MKRIGMVVAAGVLALGVAAVGAEGGKWSKAAHDGKPLWAVIHTSAGDIGVKLFSADAPETVANFVGLATGEKEWTDPNSGAKSKKPLYPGTIVHRVIPKFMIQMGDPTGTGRGSPGYQFADELKGDHAFDKPGVLAMANAGPGTNGSQFFVTVAATPWLNKHHTIFGEVVFGQDVADKISNADRNPQDRPLDDISIKSIEVLDHAPKAGGK